jgi:hypothetical protein
MYGPLVNLMVQISGMARYDAAGFQNVAWRKHSKELLCPSTLESVKVQSPLLVPRLVAVDSKH